MEKILDIVEVIAYEKGLPKELITSSLKDCLIKMAKKEIADGANFLVVEDINNKDLKLAQIFIVVSDDEFNEEIEHTHMPLSKAKLMLEEVKIGDTLECQINLDIMGNNAVNNIYQDIEFQLQRLLEKKLLDKLKENLNKIITGKVIYVDENENTFIEVEEIRATLPLKNRIKGERFKVGDMVSAILKFYEFRKQEVYIELSRTTPKMLEELLKLEVPEINDGEVQIYKSARIPGEKAKVALISHNPRIDPIGSTVGTKGTRINSVSKELKNESIDCIEYSSIPEVFITRALSPAKILGITLEPSQEEGIKPNAHISILKSQKSKAIGKSGINIRLASMLTGYNILFSQTQDDVQDIKQEERQEGKTGLQALESLFKDA